MTTAIEAGWVLKTMAAMAAADQRLDAREVSLIQKVYAELTGRPVDVGGVVSAVQVYARKNVLAELSAVAGGLNFETKEAIIRGACRTLTVNNFVSESERTKLRELAETLHVSGQELDAILNDAGGA